MTAKYFLKLRANINVLCNVIYKCKMKYMELERLYLSSPIKVHLLDNIPSAPETGNLVANIRRLARVDHSSVKSDDIYLVIFSGRGRERGWAKKKRQH